MPCVRSGVSGRQTAGPTEPPRVLCYHRGMVDAEHTAASGRGFRSVGSVRAAVVGLAVVAVAAASGQDFIAEANGLYQDIVEARRSEGILLPALSAVAPPPVGVDTPERAALAFVGSSGWDAASAWAQDATQQAMVRALLDGTAGDEYDTARAFAQPYGVSGVSVTLIRAGMYTELGDPPLLADAAHLYMSRLEDLRCLVHVESTRLAGEGRHADAMDLLLALAKFGYQMADREFVTESRWGYHAMSEAISRIRDIAYADFRGSRAIGPAELKAVIDALHPTEGPMRLDRLNFPRADRVATRQLISALYEERGGVNSALFVPTMVRLATGDRPLRRFSAASFYEGRAATQKDWFEIDGIAKNVFESWEKKWERDRFDPIRALAFAWDQGLAGDDALVVRVGVGGDMGVLFDLRDYVDLERVGTRQALGVLAEYYSRGSFPTAIDAIRPRWVDRLEDDPLNVSREGGGQPPMRYFRPVTDAYQADKRVEPGPHEMQVFPGDGTNFEVVLNKEQFLLYSTGADGRDNSATRMSRDPESLVGDYLIWPPMLSLHRTHLQQIGELD